MDTSFLPDRDREEEENKLREELRQVYKENHIVPSIQLYSFIELFRSGSKSKKRLNKNPSRLPTGKRRPLCTYPRINSKDSAHAKDR